MKTNTMTVDAFLILVVKNSFFVCLPIDCFLFVQTSSCIYSEAPQRSVLAFLMPDRIDILQAHRITAVALHLEVF